MSDLFTAQEDLWKNQSKNNMTNKYLEKAAGIMSNGKAVVSKLAKPFKGVGNIVADKTKAFQSSLQRNFDANTLGSKKVDSATKTISNARLQVAKAVGIGAAGGAGLSLMGNHLRKSPDNSPGNTNLSSY